MAMIPNQSPTNLMEMYSSPSPMLWDIANQQQNQFSQSNYLNQLQAAQGMDFAQQEQPFKLDQLGLANDTTRAALPGVQANSSILQNKADISNSTLDQQKQEALSKLATSVSNDDLTQAENAIKTALTHSSAEVRQAAQGMWENLSSIKEMKYKQDQETARAIEVAKQNGSNSLAVENAGIAAGKYSNKKWMMSLSQQINNEHDPIKLDALLRQAVDGADTPEEAQKYVSRIAANKPAYDAKMAATATAATNKLDVPGLAGIPAAQSPTAQVPFAASSPSQDKPTTGSTLEELDPATQQKVKLIVQMTKAGQLSPEAAKLQLQQLGMK